MIENLGSNKQIIRREAKKLRKTLPLDKLGAAIARRVENLPEFKSAREILTYYPIAGEPDVFSLIQKFSEKRWFLPKIEENGALWFFRHHPGDPLAPHSHGMCEPVTGAPPLPGFDETDLILLPGLAYDRRGHRLGYGKGYYDRFLAKLPDNWPGLTVGLTPEVLLMERLPIDPWDRPVKVILTESRALRIDPHSQT